MKIIVEIDPREREHKESRKEYLKRVFLQAEEDQKILRMPIQVQGQHLYQKEVTYIARELGFTPLAVLHLCDGNSMLAIYMVS